MPELTHLAKRFFGSLLPLGPSAMDNAWSIDKLLPGEVDLWYRMSRQDRRHAASVARHVDRLLDEPPRPVLAAALLHDVGKIDAGLGTFRRALATVAVMIAGRDAADLWVKSRGVTRRFGLYVKHPQIGGDLLAMAGSDELTSAWAREHHGQPEQSSLPFDIASALSLADND